MTERDTFETRFHGAVRGYVGRVSSDLDPVELASRIVATEPRRRGHVTTLRWAGGTVPRLAWLLLVAALLVALAGAALVGSRLLNTTPLPVRQNASLVPTGIDVITPDHGAYGRVVADGTGAIWARDIDGRLVRYDPGTGAGRAWTVADDASLGTMDIAGSRAGGVWLIGPNDVRRFDGDVFREVIPTAGAVTLLAEGPDRAVWAVTRDSTLLHWNGSAWDRVDAGRPASKPAASRVSALAVDAAGHPWLGWTSVEEALGLEPPTTAAAAPTTAPVTPSATTPEAPKGEARDSEAPEGWVARLDGSTWTTWDAQAAAPLGAAVVAILPAADGMVSVATGDGFARFDGSTWSDATAGLAEPRCHRGWACPRLFWAVGPDGVIWAAGEAFGDSPGSGDIDLPGNDIIVRRFDGTTWTGWDGADGLPSINGGESRGIPEGPGGLYSGLIVASALPVAGGTFVGTAAGIYELADGRWDRVWPPEASPAGTLTDLLPISHEEIWAIGDRGVWHFEGGSWTAESVDPEHPGGTVADLALALDGTLWAAGADGVAYRRDGRWTVADPTAAGGIAFGPDGTVWVVGRSCRIWTLRLGAAGWVRTAIGECPLTGDSKAAWTLAVDGRGVTWVGGRGFGDPGLARYAGGRWETIDAIDGARVDGTTVLGATPPADPWIRLPDGVARFDGTAWHTVALPTGSEWELVVAPDGSLWTTVPTGPGTTRIARFDGTTWHTVALPAGVEPPTTSVAVAPDGTVFAVGSGVPRGSGVPNGTTILRLPATR